MRHYRYEVHLVGYGDTRFEIQNPFRILTTEAPLSEIFTPIETDDLALAYASLVSQSQYLLSLPAPTVGHVKLEEMRAELDIISSCCTCNERALYPLLPPAILYRENRFVGAWACDVHIEGHVCPKLAKRLREDKWIFLEYEHAGGAEAVFTKHYAAAAHCAEAYRLMAAYLQSRGGLTGRIYWETALGYCVVQR